MKTTCITCLFFFLSISIFGQKASSFDFILGFDKSNRINQALDRTSSSGINPAFYERSPNEIGKQGWRIGLNYSQVLFTDFKIKLGVRLMHGGFSSGEINDFFTQEQQDGQDGWIVEPPLTDRYEKIYNFYFLELPIGLRYEYEVTGKYQPYIEVGMGPAILVGSQVTEISNIQIKRSKLDNLQQVHFVSYLSAGINRTINEDNMIFFQPTIRVHTTTLQKESDQEDFLYSIGLEFGWRKVMF